MRLFRVSRAVYSHSRILLFYGEAHPWMSSLRLSTTSYIRSLQQKIEELEGRLNQTLPGPGSNPNTDVKPNAVPSSSNHDSGSGFDLDQTRPPLINASSSSSSTIPRSAYPVLTSPPLQVGQHQHHHQQYPHVLNPNYTATSTNNNPNNSFNLNLETRSHISSPRSIHSIHSHSPSDRLAFLHPPQSSHSGQGYSGVTRLGHPEAHRVWKHRTLLPQDVANGDTEFLHPVTRTAYPLDLDTTLREMRVGGSGSRSGVQAEARASRKGGGDRPGNSAIGPTGRADLDATTTAKGKDTERTDQNPRRSKKRKLDVAGDIDGSRSDDDEGSNNDRTGVGDEYDTLVDRLTDRELPRRMVQRVTDKWLQGDDVHILYQQ